MDSEEFEAELNTSGYTEIATKRMDPRPPNGEHGHEYAVRGLVTAGEFIIASNVVPRSFQAGEIFEVAAGQLHSEAVGPEGTRITTGRMY